MAYTPDQIALAIIAEGQNARTDGTPETQHGVISPRGIQIALATAIVESGDRVLANPNVPESENLPNDGDGYDHMSTGEMQQQPQWWGTVAEEMDPRLSAGMFYHALENHDYNNTANSPGSYAQAVQGSAFPDRYDQHFQEAVDQYNRLTAAPAPAPAAPEAPVDSAPPAFNEINDTANNNNDESRQGQQPRLFVLHTEEGAMLGEGLERWMAANEVSYHYIVDNDGSVVDMETTDVASWSVLDPANEFTINLVFGGSTVNWNRLDWLNNMGNGIKVAAWIAVRDCQRYGIPTQILVGPNYSRIVTENGITDHFAFTANRFPGSTHTDCGPNFPWDVFNTYVQQYAGQPVLPPPPPPPPAPAPAPARTYTVQSGDSLWNIEQQFNLTQDALLAANPSITDPNMIYAGQVLEIPSN